MIKTVLNINLKGMNRSTFDGSHVTEAETLNSFCKFKKLSENTFFTIFTLFLLKCLIKFHISIYIYIYIYIQIIIFYWSTKKMGTQTTHKERKMKISLKTIKNPTKFIKPRRNFSKNETIWSCRIKCKVEKHAFILDFQTWFSVLLNSLSVFMKSTRLNVNKKF